MRKMLKRSMTVSALTVLLAAGFTGEAVAQDDPGSGGTLPCVNTTGAMACFDKAGDHVYVQDTLADGHHAEGYVTANDYSWWSPNCKNYNGAGTWVHCDFDVPDGKFALLYAVRLEGTSVLNEYPTAVTT